MKQNKVNTCKISKTALCIIVFAGLAQVVEQRIRNAWVVCSSHITGTILFKGLGQINLPYLYFVNDTKKVPILGTYKKTI